MDKKTIIIIILTIALIAILAHQSNNNAKKTDTAAEKTSIGENSRNRVQLAPIDENNKSKNDTLNNESAASEAKKAEPRRENGAAEEEADLKLTAEALGGGSVKLTWTAPDGLDESNRFILVRDKQENPEHTGKNFWIRQNHLKREVIWKDNPAGTMHYRICITENNKKDICVRYSNDAEITVK